MECIVVITMPGEIMFAGPVTETRTTAAQYHWQVPVPIVADDAKHAFNWAVDDATEGATEHDIPIQVWLIRNGQVIEYERLEP